MTMIGKGAWWQGDCLELMKRVPDASVDMILADLPYGTTACKWDSVIPFEPLWEQYHRIAKPRAAIVLTASQPFTSALVMSNVKNFKYEWVWRKDKPNNFALANRTPMKYHENVCVFYRRQPTYNKILEEREGSGVKRIKYKVDNSNQKSDHLTLNDEPKMFGELRNPSSVQFFSTGQRQKGTHPTQKPVALFEYLIRTYTNEGQVVMDNTAGSGTTAIACENTNRHWLCMEQDAEYSRIAIERIRKHVT